VIYTVFAKARPIRTAFILDVDVFLKNPWHCDAVIDGIVTFAIEAWGGRLNPIFPIAASDDLSLENWTELEASDPDRIQAFAPLNAAWIERFHKKLIPWKITTQDAIKETKPEGDSPEALWRWFPVSVPALGTPPFAERLKRRSNAKLLMIEFAPECPLEIRRFFHRNFGTYFQWIDNRTAGARRIGWLENILGNIETEIFRIGDLSSACSALVAFGGSFLPPKPLRPLNFIAPTEISAVNLGNRFPRGPYQHIYRVFVGDSLYDFTAYWNELWMCGCWHCPHLHALWVPASLVSEPTFMQALAAFLYHYSGQHSSGSKTVEITSNTLSINELESACTSLRTNGRIHRVTAADGATRRSNLRKQLGDALAPPRPRPLLDGNNAQRLRISEPTETLSLTKPDILVGNGSWAADIQIEFGAGDRFQSRQWWCLPRRTGTELVKKVFLAPARISRSYMMSVQINLQTTMHGQPVMAELHVGLPDESNVVASLLLGDPVGYDHDDLRQQLSKPTRRTRVKTSDKGQNLRGLIETFGGFWVAEVYCKRRFWREALAKLAGHDARRQETLSERIQNAIFDEIRLDGKKDEMRTRAEQITSRVLPHVHGALEDEPMGYTGLKKLLEKVSATHPHSENIQYTAGSTIVHYQGIPSMSEEDMKVGLNQLLARNILRAGVMVRCPHCGIESWLHVDEVKQLNECGGCGNVRPLSVDAEWRYRLNSLGKRCVSQRILTVLHALTSIASHSSTCFFYSPNIDLLESDSERTWHELDVLCVTDGKLVIGEVKDGSFDQKELDRFAEAIEVIVPDIAALFVPQERCDHKTNQLFSKLQTRLNKTGISAELHQLPTF
jgi:hypothetical protein